MPGFFPEEESQALQSPSLAPPPRPAGPVLSSSFFPADTAPDKLTDAMGRATATPPDTAARIFGLQTKTGLPPEVIARNLDVVEKQAAAADFDPVAFRKSSPLLASWLEQHPLNAALTKDDLVPLSAVEKTLRVASNSVRATLGGLTGGINLGAWSLLEAAGDVLGAPSLTAWGKALNAQAREMAAGVKGPQTGAGPNEQ